ncbi:MAG: nitroreductase family protein [Bacteroidales bacterium]|nr:nitroreductase family protein [Bacteroidales bacterium]
MAIPTTRTKEPAEIQINTSLCSGCGLCVEVCKDFSLVLQNEKVTINENPVFGCIACGHCMAICPNGAIKVNGRTLDESSFFDIPAKTEMPDYKQIISLYQRRRSIREFLDKDIEEEKVQKIIDAAANAPMGLPPSDVRVLVFRGKEKSRAFAFDFVDYLQSFKYLTSNWFLALMRPFWGKENDELFKGFVRPMVDVYTNGKVAGNNYVNYDAPLLLYFYGSPYSDPADPIIAATYAMIAAESLGLGSCMLGAVHPLIQNGSKAAKFREKWGIKFKSREGLFLAIGYSKVKYKSGISRSFASVDFVS